MLHYCIQCGAPTASPHPQKDISSICSTRPFSFTAYVLLELDNVHTRHSQLVNKLITTSFHFIMDGFSIDIYKAPWKYIRMQQMNAPEFPELLFFWNNMPSEPLVNSLPSLTSNTNSCFLRCRDEPAAITCLNEIKPKSYNLFKMSLRNKIKIFAVSLFEIIMCDINSIFRTSL